MMLNKSISKRCRSTSKGIETNSLENRNIVKPKRKRIGESLSKRLDRGLCLGGSHSDSERVVVDLEVAGGERTEGAKGEKVSMD